MPLYEYRCESCGHTFEKIQKFSDPHEDTCPKCGGVVKKLVSSPAIQFKGSGWYITDYAKKPSSDAGSKTKTDTSASSDTSESTAAPAKPASGDSTKKD
jgi:putative FmdB family regulatory protein